MPSDLLAALLKLCKAGCYYPASSLPFMPRYYKQAAAKRACDQLESAKPLCLSTTPLSF
jgi:hypothetical protein